METNVPWYSRGRSMPVMNLRTDGSDSCSFRLTSSCLRIRSFSPTGSATDSAGATRTAPSSTMTDQPWLARSPSTFAAAIRLAWPV